jgi:hypothetical protein
MNKVETDTHPSPRITKQSGQAPDTNIQKKGEKR